jgi:hypothetical protein
VSLDGGKQWAQYKGGDLPDVAVRDIVVHPRDNDLVIATHGRGIWIVDDITPLRALTPQMLEQEATFVPGRPAVQRMLAQGGWVDGDASFTGPNPPGDAVITYYQRRRHVFGDLSMDVRDASGKVLATVPSSKRRGLNRVTWSMRMPAPKSPPAATGGATVGPRLPPDTYTVTMSKGGANYTMPLQVVADPRAKHSAADRKAQFELSKKLYDQFTDMTYAVEKINAVRGALDQRAAALPAGDPLAKQLQADSAKADELRKEIVATKEGGMITGEERLREELSNLYFNVVFYEGAPSATQIARADALGRELADVLSEFDAWTAKELPAVNAALAKKSQPPIEPMSREAWEGKGKGGS